jgi:hypothetical protein
VIITGPLKIWTSADGRMHFMSVPDDRSGEIRLHALEMPRGFGSVRVEVSLGAISWRTSVFPVKSGGYFLPIKIDVVRKAGIAAGDEDTVGLELL